MCYRKPVCDNAVSLKKLEAKSYLALFPYRSVFNHLEFPKKIYIFLPAIILHLTFFKKKLYQKYVFRSPIIKKGCHSFYPVVSVMPHPETVPHLVGQHVGAPKAGGRVRVVVVRKVSLPLTND